MYRFGKIEFFAENMHHRSFFYTNHIFCEISVNKEKSFLAFCIQFKERQPGPHLLYF